MTKLVEWSERFSVGITKLDDHHKVLFNIINDMKIECDKEKPGELDGFFRALLEYTEYHFTAEEAVMKKMNYPQIEDHKKQHPQKHLLLD